MPVFDVVCTECAKVYTKFALNKDRALSSVQCCGEVKLVPTTFAPHFKGSGFHATDYPSVDKVVGEDASRRWEAFEARTESKRKLLESVKEGETVVRDDVGNYEKVSLPVSGDSAAIE